MKNYVNEGKAITVTAAAAVASGAGVLAGALFGVAQGDAEAGEPLVLVRCGQFDLAKTSAQAWTVGAKLYWDNSNNVVTTAASGNTLIGCAGAAAANPSATGTVILDGAVR
ncbi:DUF2190 family protein [Yoonia sp. 208BN28-4]|uniref:DUF2190 family protein n=1 Tax=Yoonia sp. 208BN28-4 TaxID=3126505 RepID=UPI0030B5A104